MTLANSLRRPAILYVALCGAVAVLALALTGGLILHRQALEQEQSRKGVLHTLQALSAIDDVLATLQELETNQRGYMLTDNDAFLQQRDRTLIEVAGCMAQLRRTAAGKPDQQRVLQQLEPLVTAKIAFMEDSLALHRRDPATASAMIKTGRGKELMDRIRAEVDHLRRAETARLHAAQLREEQDTRRGRLLLYGLTAGASLCFALLLGLLLRDILLRQRLTAQLEHTSTVLGAVAETMAQGLAVFDPELRLLQWNQRWLELMDIPEPLVFAGADFETILGQLRSRGELEGNTPAEMVSVLRATMVARKNTRYSWRTAHGLWLEAQSQPRPDGSVVITYTDITALKLAEQSYSEQAARLAAVLDNASDAIVTINESGTVESFNAAAEKLFGYSAGEVLQRNVRALMPEPYGSSHDHYLRHYLTTGERRVIGERRELEGLRRDGEVFPLELAVSEMWLGSKRLFIGILRDISERRAVERMKNEFISTVSHELRTPLTSIAGSLGLLAGGAVGALPEQTARLIGIAHKNSERLVRLINDLLDIEKIEAGKMHFAFAPLELLPLLDQAVDSHRDYAAGLGVTLQRDEAAPPGRVLADADRLMQVLQNLISNALKFSPPGGTVRLGILDRGEALRLTVHDDGPGVPETFRERIFNKFAQADASDSRQKGGTGLGLSIAKRIVERHGGRIGFDSDTQGGGTTFWVDLQRWREPLPQPAELAAARVLVCEDDAEVAAALALTVRAAGLTADVVHTLAEARARLAATRYAVMTLDLLLPDGDGLTLLRQLRNEPATALLPVIVVSARADEQRRLEHMGALEVAGWLPKPVQPECLLQAVQCAARGRGGRRLRLLHVEDDVDVVSVVRLALHDIASVAAAHTLSAARELLERESFDAVVLDISLPDGSGLDLLESLRRPTAVPVVIFSAQDPGPQVASQVHAALIKSKASIEALIAAVQQHSQRDAAN